MRKCASWSEPLSEGETLDVLCDLADLLLQRSESAPCQQLRGLVRKGEFAKVVDFEVDYEGWDIATIRIVRQVTALFSKLEFLDIGVDKEAAAVQSFLEAEDRCRETNDLFRAIHSGRAAVKPFVAGVLHAAQRKMSDLLGPCPKLQSLGLRFGPGATSLVKKREASVKRKLGKGVSCSEDLVQWAPALLNEMPHIARLHASAWAEDGDGYWGTVPVVLHWGAVSFVPKNAKTHRTTETQPTLNGMLQLGIGDEMSRRLSRVPGLDLRDQSLNQRLARIGSLTGELATLDQKSASNCMAFELVRSLTPLDWFALLRAARCGKTALPGKGVISLEMFAGMGNGYTFPLQSAIFYSLAWATAHELGVRNPIISVYGDDLVVDTKVVKPLLEVLDVCGFWVNTRKSFFTGRFRESCGSDWVSGTDVRPVYVKKALTPAILFSLHNGLRRKGWDAAAEFVHDLVHPDLRIYGPDDYGDGHLLDPSWEERARQRGLRRGWRGLVFDTYQFTSKRDWTYHPGDRILHTYAIYRRDATDIAPEIGADWAFCNVVRRGERLRFLRAWVTGHGECSDGTPIPFGSDDSSYGPPEMDLEGLLWQGHAKAPTFPGIEGYRKTAVYIVR